MPALQKRGRAATSQAKGERIADQRSLALNTSLYENAELVSPDKPLTEKQLLFAKYWAEGDTPHNAALRAGYASTGGQSPLAYRMIRMPNILRVYKAEKAKYEEASQMTRKKVMDMLVEAYDMAKLMAEPASMVSAAREVGKMSGYYEPVVKKIDITMNGKAMVKKLDQMSDEELQKIIMDGVAAVEMLEMAKEEEDDE